MVHVDTSQHPTVSPTFPPSMAAETLLDTAQGVGSVLSSASPILPFSLSADDHPASKAPDPTNIQEQTTTSTMEVKAEAAHSQPASSAPVRTAQIDDFSQTAKTEVDSMGKQHVFRRFRTNPKYRKNPHAELSSNGCASGLRTNPPRWALIKSPDEASVRSSELDEMDKSGVMSAGE